MPSTKRNRRSLTDDEWADRVITRWNRRRWKVQQREKAIAELKATLLDSAPYRAIAWLADRLERIARH